MMIVNRENFHAANIPSFSTSSTFAIFSSFFKRFTALWKYSSDSSHPIKLRFSFIEATAVVHEPKKQSKTKSPLFECFLINSEISPIGFCVG